MSLLQPRIALANVSWQIDGETDGIGKQMILSFSNRCAAELFSASHTQTFTISVYAVGLLFGSQPIEDGSSVSSENRDPNRKLTVSKSKISTFSFVFATIHAGLLHLANDRRLEGGNELGRPILNRGAFAWSLGNLNR